MGDGQGAFLAGGQDLIVRSYFRAASGPGAPAGREAPALAEPVSGEKMVMVPTRRRASRGGRSEGGGFRRVGLPATPPGLKSGRPGEAPAAQADPAARFLFGTDEACTPSRGRLGAIALEARAGPAAADAAAVAAPVPEAGSMSTPIAVATLASLNRRASAAPWSPPGAGLVGTLIEALALSRGHGAADGSATVGLSSERGREAQVPEGGAAAAVASPPSGGPADREPSADGSELTCSQRSSGSDDGGAAPRAASSTASGADARASLLGGAGEALAPPLARPSRGSSGRSSARLRGERSESGVAESAGAPTLEDRSHPAIVRGYVVDASYASAGRPGSARGGAQGRVVSPTSTGAGPADDRLGPEALEPEAQAARAIELAAEAERVRAMADWASGGGLTTPSLVAAGYFAEGAMAAAASGSSSGGLPIGSTGSGQVPKRCRCRRSACLKMYCECFAAGGLCGPDCGCEGCRNDADHAEEVQGARRVVLAKDPMAFRAKVTGAGGHRKGCKCRRSACQKKYCECFNAGVKCNPLVCSCEGCKNCEPGPGGGGAGGGRSRLDARGAVAGDGGSGDGAGPAGAGSGPSPPLSVRARSRQSDASGAYAAALPSALGAPRPGVGVGQAPLPIFAYDRGLGSGGATSSAPGSLQVSAAGSPVMPRLAGEGSRGEADEGGARGFGDVQGFGDASGAGAGAEGSRRGFVAHRAPYGVRPPGLDAASASALAAVEGPAASQQLLRELAALPPSVVASLPPSLLSALLAKAAGAATSGPAQASSPLLQALGVYGGSSTPAPGPEGSSAAPSGIPTPAGGAGSAATSAAETPTSGLAPLAIDAPRLARQAQDAPRAALEALVASHGGVEALLASRGGDGAASKPLRDALALAGLLAGQSGGSGSQTPRSLSPSRPRSLSASPRKAGGLRPAHQPLAEEPTTASLAAAASGPALPRTPPRASQLTPRPAGTASGEAASGRAGAADSDQDAVTSPAAARAALGWGGAVGLAVVGGAEAGGGSGTKAALWPAALQVESLEPPALDPQSSRTRVSAEASGSGSGVAASDSADGSRAGAGLSVQIAVAPAKRQAPSRRSGDDDVAAGVVPAPAGTDGAWAPHSLVAAGPTAGVGSGALVAPPWQLAASDPLREPDGGAGAPAQLPALELSRSDDPSEDPRGRLSKRPRRAASRGVAGAVAAAAAWRVDLASPVARRAPRARAQAGKEGGKAAARETAAGVGAAATAQAQAQEGARPGVRAALLDRLLAAGGGGDGDVSTRKGKAAVAAPAPAARHEDGDEAGIAASTLFALAFAAEAA